MGKLLLLLHAVVDTSIGTCVPVDTCMGCLTENQLEIKMCFLKGARAMNWPIVRMRISGTSAMHGTLCWKNTKDLYCTTPSSKTLRSIQGKWCQSNVYLSKCALTLTQSNAYIRLCDLSSSMSSVYISELLPLTITGSWRHTKHVWMSIQTPMEYCHNKQHPMHWQQNCRQLISYLQRRQH